MTNLILQGMRFLGIGFLNTAVDFAVLNFLTTLFGIYEGFALFILNVISFTTAVAHSYYWNKNWAFASSTSEKLFENLAKFVGAAGMGALVIAAAFAGAQREYGTGFYLSLILILAVCELILWKWLNLANLKAATNDRKIFIFFAVSVVGVLINSGIITLLTSYVDPVFGLNEKLWLNLAKAAATAVSLVWNFAGYKVFVFRR